MNEQAFQTLEYGDLRALVRRHAQTEMGGARAEELAPLASVEEVRRALPAGSGGPARWARRAGRALGWRPHGPRDRPPVERQEDAGPPPVDPAARGPVRPRAGH